MKTVLMERDYDYRPTRSRLTAYKAGKTYGKVPESAATAIKDAGAGRVVGEDALTESMSGRGRNRR